MGNKWLNFLFMVLLWSGSTFEDTRAKTCKRPKGKNGDLAKCQNGRWKRDWTLKEIRDTVSEIRDQMNDLVQLSLHKEPAKGENNTVGHLFGADISFSDEEFGTVSNITKVVMYTGRYNGQDGVIVGVRFTYGTNAALLHGRITETFETCNFDVNDGEYIETIRAQAINIPNGRLSMIYALTFIQNDPESGEPCEAGNTLAGQPYTFRNKEYPLNYIYGRTTLASPRMLGSLSFVYYNKETCPECHPGSDATITP